MSQKAPSVELNPKISLKEIEQKAIKLNLKAVALAMIAAKAAVQTDAVAKKKLAHLKRLGTTAHKSHIGLRLSQKNLTTRINQACNYAKMANKVAELAERKVKKANLYMVNINDHVSNIKLKLALHPLRAILKKAVSYSSNTAEKVSEIVHSTALVKDEMAAIKIDITKVLVRNQLNQTQGLKYLKDSVEAAQIATELASAAAKKAKETASKAAHQAAASTKITLDIIDTFGAKRGIAVASAAKASFLANLSHEIRTPLSAIIGFSELIFEKLASKTYPDLTKEVEVVYRNSKYLETLINDFLDISKIDSGTIQIEVVPISLRKEIAELIETLTEKIQESASTIKIDFNPNVPEFLFTDPMRLRQILFNLIGNAIKFTSHGKIEINISLSEKSKSGGRGLLIVEIKDSGIGIPLDSQKILFEAYCQADCSTARKFGGTGLGLMVAKKLGQLLGGDVVLKKSAPGKGSTFEVRIAVKKLDKNAQKLMTNEKQPVQKEAPPLKGCKILLAEDSADLQFLFRTRSEAAGAEVKVASNGEEAIKMAGSEKFDLVVMDIEMPVLNGNLANIKLREKGYKSPILAFTAHATLSKEYFGNAIYDDYITKPVKSKELIEKLQKWYSKTKSPTL